MSVETAYQVACCAEEEDGLASYLGAWLQEKEEEHAYGQTDCTASLCPLASGACGASAYEVAFGPDPSETQVAW